MRGLSLALMLLLSGCDRWDAVPPSETKTGQIEIDVPDSFVQASISISTKAVQDELLAKYSTTPIASGETGFVSAKIWVAEKTTTQKLVDYVETPYKAAGCEIIQVASQCPQNIVRRIKDKCIKGILHKPFDCFKTIVETQMVPCLQEQKSCWPEIKEAIKSRLEPGIEIHEALLPTSANVHWSINLLQLQITALEGGIRVRGKFKVGVSIDLKAGVLTEIQTVKGVLACDSDIGLEAIASTSVTAAPSIDLVLRDFTLDAQKICIPGAVQLMDFELANPTNYIRKELLRAALKEVLVRLLNEQLQKAIGDKLEFGEALAELAKEVAQSIKIGDGLWLQIHPSKIWVSQLHASGGDGDQNALEMKVAVSARPIVAAGQRPEEAAGEPLAIAISDNLTDEFFLSVRGSADLNSAQGRLQKLVAEMWSKNFSSAPLMPVSTRIYQSGKRFAIGVVLATGSSAKPVGTVYLLAEPYVDEATGTVRLRDVVFDVDSKRVLLKTANWLLSGLLEKIIEDGAEFRYGGLLESIEESVGDRFSSGRFQQKTNFGEIRAKIEKVEIKNVWIADESLNITALARGRMDLVFSSEKSPDQSRPRVPAPPCLRAEIK
jgi:hypothetical protein